jgi:hypothetical protein
MRVSAAYAALKRRSSTVVLAVVASFIASGRVLKGRIKVKGGGRECVSHTRVSSCARMDSRGRLSLHVRVLA